MTRKTTSLLSAWTLAVATATSLLATACVTDVSVDDGAGAGAGEGDTPAADDSAKFIRSSEPVSDSYIVVMEADDKGLRSRGGVFDATAVTADLSATYGAQVDRTFDGLDTFSAVMSETDARKLASDPRVRFVEENGKVHINASQSNATWGIDRIDQNDRPLSGTYTYNNTASNVNAYVIDTGIRITHAEFGGRATSGFSAIDDSNGTNDCNGHGTHVSGTIGSNTYGVAKGVHLVAVRVLDCEGSGDDAGVIAGINWVTQNHQGPSVANMSLGGGDSSALDAAVQKAIDAGVTFAVAAGNDNANACSGSPNKLPDAITVGSSTSSDGRSSFSNWGTCLDIFAPGSSITSTWNSSNTATNSISGTSMASPHVAGAAALVLGANPTYSPQQVRDALVNNASSGKVTSPGTGSPNKLLYTGFIGGTNPDPDPNPNPNPNPGQGTPKTFTETTSVRAGVFKQYPARAVKAGTQLKAIISGVTGDPDLYVRLGSAPTTRAYSCRPYKGANETEECTVNVTSDTSAFVGVRGYESGNYTIKIDWVEP